MSWAERIAELTLDPWQRDVLLSVAPRLLQALVERPSEARLAEYREFLTAFATMPPLVQRRR